MPINGETPSDMQVGQTCHSAAYTVQAEHSPLHCPRRTADRKLHDAISCDGTLRRATSSGRIDWRGSRQGQEYRRFPSCTTTIGSDHPMANLALQIIRALRRVVNCAAPSDERDPEGFLHGALLSRLVVALGSPCTNGVC